MLTVLLGGARSGKSSAALRLAEPYGDSVTFVATGPRIAGDDDLDARIAAHRAERPPEWTTLEAEVDLAPAIARSGSDLVIVDCLTVWVGNLVHHGHDDGAVRRRSAEALAAASGRPGDAIVVTNEVGLGIVPGDAISRRYRDLLGRVNGDWVGAADRALLLVAGRALDLTRWDDLADVPTRGADR